MSKDQFYQQLQESLLPKVAPVIESSQSAYLTINGKKKLNLCSSHYLGFADNKEIKEKVKKAVDEYGIGTGYRTLAGNHKLHVELEERLAKFKHAEAAIVLTGGYMANCAAITTLIGKEDIVISDELNHASIIDAIRLSGVKTKLIYRHTDMQDLEKKLQEANNNETTLPAGRQVKQFNNRVLIVTDGVFSMDGDLAPLPEIVALAEKYNAITMVDDAHGEGVLGQKGRGIVDHFGLHGKVDIEVGTLSKAFSVMGGFITGKKVLIDFYKQKARQYLFSNALTIPDTAAVLAGLEILETSNEPVKKVWENATYIKEKLTALGFNCGNSATPITPIMLGDEELAKQFSTKLFDLDIFATPILFPMVPKGTARIRLIPSAAHTKEDYDKVITVFEIVGNEIGLVKRNGSE